MPTFQTSDGLNLHYEDDGQGKPLLCLPGLTRNGRDFAFLAAKLDGARLIRLDYRGRGQSDFDPDFANYNVLREGHDVLELLDHLNLGQVTVLGTSRGGLIAMALAAGHADRMAGVILNDIGPVVGAAGLARIMAYVGKRPDYADYDTAAAGLADENAQEFPGVSLDRWRAQAQAQFTETPDGLDLRYDSALHKALLEQAAAGAMPDLWLFFEALKDLPVAVIRGANSDILSADTVAEMRARHPGLLSAEIPDRGHTPFLDEPEALTLIRHVLGLDS